ncbi:protein indeterminate-domain 4, chloroplastic-like [Vicia villosa]|uniref:protein indeterminate-domain 4, chloroplastic-like n=1 Tax=Vicia villosa TaxID=3911 RepID=UPI00273B1871|nr:protein indeterminate-domain 4, chloroplastic-like [Vicia villosa]XP_058724121.1 protein indeterminate-domain 4, chloroplastic-like [Vicia villosa]
MAASSSSTPFLEIRQENQSQITQQHQSSTDVSSTAAQPLVPKKRRNQPGTPYPDAEVIALSPKTLMATNRFVCEVCQKGFQREQNLQLHRRGHNLPWKLKQKSNKEPKRKVYLCPEPSCVHHDPSRALGDLTGIKKHFSRKHGEKKWKCEKCSKKYAVQSDWKAHSKTCGTREYRCDCGTLFSRRDSFITHRAFCDALAHENARHPSNMNPLATHLFSTNHMGLALNQNQQTSTNNILTLGNIPCTPKYENHLISPLHPSSSSLSFVQQQQQQQSPQQQSMSSSPFFMTDPNQTFQQDLSSPFSNKQLHLHHGLLQLPDLQGNTNNNTTSSSVSPFNLSFFPNTNSSTLHDQFNNISEPHHHHHHQHQEGFSSLFGNSSMQQENMLSSPHMSATALLQKAAQIGSTTTTTINNNGVESNNEGLRSSMENEQNQHLHGLLNSLGNGNTSIYGNMNHDNNINLGQFQNMEENKKMPQQNLAGNLCFGGSDKLTLDFLGVGGMVRNMSGGFSQREQQLHSMSSMNNMDPKLESTQANQPF